MLNQSIALSKAVHNLAGTRGITITITITTTTITITITITITTTITITITITITTTTTRGAEALLAMLPPGPLRTSSRRRTETLLIRLLLFTLYIHVILILHEYYVNIQPIFTLTSTSRRRGRPYGP